MPFGGILALQADMFDHSAISRAILPGLTKCPQQAQRDKLHPVQSFTLLKGGKLYNMKNKIGTS